MFRSYWLYIIVFALVLSLPPQGGRAEEQNPPDDKQITVANPFSWIFDSEEKPDRLTQPCEPGENNRNSDLCAQWKAADAARDSARWARYTFWISVVGAAIGVLTLGAAIAAAIFAGSASKHTKSGADAAWEAAKEAKRQADLVESFNRRLERPYLFPKVVRKYFSGTQEGFVPKIRWTINNHGKTPAVLKRVFSEFVPISHIRMANNTPIIADDATIEEWHEVIIPSGELNNQIAETLAVDIGKNVWPVSKETIVLHGHIFYENVSRTAEYSHHFMMFSYNGRDFRLEFSRDSAIDVHEY
ncbi:hypothetical protein [uncultured Roseibium sp.]|uniref:hypothetical protein n=1 Tax=uncultured Roseibium sp. TaxID=1936171 RepID=UPI0032179387